MVPGASRTEIIGAHGECLKVRVAAPPEAGKANRALVSFFERALPGAAVELVAGSSSRRKRLSIEGVPPAAVERLSVD